MGTRCQRSPARDIPAVPRDGTQAPLPAHPSAGRRGLTRHTHTVQLPSDGEKTSPSARATPSCKQPANQGRVRGGHAGAQGWGCQGSPVQLGQQPPAGAGSGWEQGTGQLTASQSTRPPCRGRHSSAPRPAGTVSSGTGREGAYLAGTAPAPRLHPASARLPEGPPVPAARGWCGGTGGSLPAWGQLSDRGHGGGRGGRRLGARRCGREVGRGRAPGDQEGSPRAGREQDEGGGMLQGLKDG